MPNSLQLNVYTVNACYEEALIIQCVQQTDKSSLMEKKVKISPWATKRNVENDCGHFDFWCFIDQMMSQLTEHFLLLAK